MNETVYLIFNDEPGREYESQKSYSMPEFNRFDETLEDSDSNPNGGYFAIPLQYITYIFVNQKLIYWRDSPCCPTCGTGAEGHEFVKSCKNCMHANSSIFCSACGLLPDRAVYWSPAETVREGCHDTQTPIPRRSPPMTMKSEQDIRDKIKSLQQSKIQHIRGWQFEASDVVQNEIDTLKWALNEGKWWGAE